MKWVKIEGFPNYSVSDYGEIRNDKFHRLLSFSYKKVTHTSYARVTLFVDGVRHYIQVHRLVAKAFLPNPDNLPQVDHIDNNGLNNRARNLQWMSCSDNIKKAFTDRNELKLDICSKGGKAGSLVIQNKAVDKYKLMLGERFIHFHTGGTLIKDAAVSYICTCGVKRTASIMWKELRHHKGTCPACSNTINRSSESLL